eukprot:1842947-Rhodomonas_salina.1
MSEIDAGVWDEAIGRALVEQCSAVMDLARAIEQARRTASAIAGASPEAFTRLQHRVRAIKR